MSYVPMHIFGYTEEMLQTNLIENMKEKQESHDKLSDKKQKLMKTIY